jgi:hypothetical protein
MNFITLRIVLIYSEVDIQVNYVIKTNFHFPPFSSPSWRSSHTRHSASLPINIF